MRLAGDAHHARQRGAVDIRIQQTDLAPGLRQSERKVHCRGRLADRSEEHTSELQSLMRISYAGFCLKKKNIKNIKKQSRICIANKDTHTEQQTTNTNIME